MRKKTSSSKLKSKNKVRTILLMIANEEFLTSHKKSNMRINSYLPEELIKFNEQNYVIKFNQEESPISSKYSKKRASVVVRTAEIENNSISLGDDSNIQQRPLISQIRKVSIANKKLNSANGYGTNNANHGYVSNNGYISNNTNNCNLKVVNDIIKKNTLDESVLSFYSSNNPNNPYNPVNKIKTLKNKYNILTKKESDTKRIQKGFDSLQYFCSKYVKKIGYTCNFETNYDEELFEMLSYKDVTYDKKFIQAKNSSNKNSKSDINVNRNNIDKRESDIINEEYKDKKDSKDNLEEKIAKSTFFNQSKKQLNQILCKQEDSPSNKKVILQLNFNKDYNFEEANVSIDNSSCISSLNNNNTNRESSRDKLTKANSKEKYFDKIIFSLDLESLDRKESKEERDNLIDYKNYTNNNEQIDILNTSNNGSHVSNDLNINEMQSFHSNSNFSINPLELRENKNTNNNNTNYTSNIFNIKDMKEQYKSQNIDEIQLSARQFSSNISSVFGSNVINGEFTTNKGDSNISLPKLITEENIIQTLNSENGKINLSVDSIKIDDDDKKNDIDNCDEKYDFKSNITENSLVFGSEYNHKSSL